MHTPSFESKSSLLKVSLVTIAVTVAACLLALVVSVEPSQATFPGENGKIAFVNTGLYTIKPDGSDPTLLLGAESDIRNVVWSPDGTKIAFEHQEPSDFYDNDIYVMNADGSDLTNLTNTSIEQGEQYPRWSPDGSKLAFERNRNIWMMNADGSDQTRLTDTAPSDFGGNSAPEWSPDGSKIAFVKSLLFDEKEGSNIYVADADGSNEIPLTNNRANEFDPVWSPDGSKIAFQSTRNGYGEIFTINPNGSNLSRLTNNESADFRPVWRPDGTKIAFLCAELPGICTINPDGSDLTTITSAFSVREALWSPDGTKLLLSRDRSDSSQPGTPRLYTVNADGSDLAPLFPNDGSEWPSLIGYLDWQPLPLPLGPKSKADCRQGGYKEFGFNNQGRCIAFVNSAARNN
jgi:Tol biopolymer transport system component